MPKPRLTAAGAASSGLLNIAKPSGLTSFGVVARVRRLTGVRRVGHGGTLDPAAEGVLPVLLGQATRLTELVHEWPKTYLATLQLGSTSTTYDAEGVITRQAEASEIDEDTIARTLPAFTGRLMQVPPVFSALKRGGEPLYRKARRGEPVTLSPRPVEILRLELRSLDLTQHQAVLEVRCGRGAYVRSLAHDLGLRLGCGAYLASLTRTAVGPLALSESVALTALQEAGAGWTRWLLPLDLPLRHWPALAIAPFQATALRRGQPLPPARVPTGRYRVVEEEGGLVAWGTVDGTGRFTPAGVLAP